MKTINSLSFLLSQYTFHDKVQRKKIHVNVIVDMIRSIKFSKCFFDTFIPKKSCYDHITEAIVYNVLIYFSYHR